MESIFDEPFLRKESVPFWDGLKGDEVDVVPGPMVVFLIGKLFGLKVFALFNVMLVVPVYYSNIILVIFD